MSALDAKKLQRGWQHVFQLAKAIQLQQEDFQKRRVQMIPK